MKESLASFTFLALNSLDIANSQLLIEVLTKLGVVGILWLWLKDTKKQNKELREEFNKEHEQTRKHYDQILIEKDKTLKEHKELIEKLLKNKT